MGHRTPQGLTKVNNFIFNVEHGPKGGDELNKLIKDKNYGWPLVSYGTEYLYSNEGKSFKVNHENNNFEEPLFAFVPSIGISSLNVCPNKLRDYYNKSCLIALSLHGNSLMPGRSLIIFLLNESMNSVNSIEKIYLGEELRLRHFVTNSKNELYEDESGHIYVSADKIGIYKINFVKFR
jgi:glucose/arabinose dehydrogenase